MSNLYSSMLANILVNTINNSQFPKFAFSTTNKFLKNSKTDLGGWQAYKWRWGESGSEQVIENPAGL